MNKWLFKIHGWMALVTFLPLLVICVTGSILVFKHEIDNLLIPDKVRVVVEGHQRLSLDELRYELETSLPDYEPMGWVLFQDVGRADVVYLIKKGTGDWYYTLLDQYRGRLLSPVLTEKDHLTDWLLSLHYTFLMHDTGLLITAALAIVLCLLGITGLILYRKFWKNLFTLRRKARLVVYFSDLHKMAGFYTSPILLILGITGAYWNIVHFVHELEEHKDGAEHYKVEGPLYNTALSLQALHDDAQQQLSGFKPTYLSLPAEGAERAFRGRRGIDLLTGQFRTGAVVYLKTFLTAQDVFQCRGDRCGRDSIGAGLLRCGRQAEAEGEYDNKQVQKGFHAILIGRIWAGRAPHRVGGAH